MGPLSAAKGYDCITSISNIEERNPVFDSLWALNIPTKLACFIWLLVKGRILSWEQIQSRGYHGPSRCILCERNCEDILHLFLVCPFTVKIFSHFAARYGFSVPLFNSVQSFLVHWFSTTARSAAFRYLPLFAFWCIWLLRNKCIFENWKPSVHSLISRVKSYQNLYPVPQKSLKKRIIGPKPQKVFPCGFFDGAAAGNIGGAGFCDLPK